MNLAFTLLFLLSIQQTPEPPPAIQFPDIAAPTPPPSPRAPVPLNAEELYVVTSETAMLAWAFPEGILNLTSEQNTGKWTIRGKFAGGGGKVETRTYTAKYLLIAEASKTGQASLLVLPAGATKQTDGIVKLIDANVGPRPPPIPPDPTPPKPDNPAPIAAPGFHVLVVYEEADLSKYTPGQKATITGKAMRDYLDTKCAKDGKLSGYWIVDKDVPTGAMPAHFQAAMKRPRTGTPWLIVSNGVTGWEGPLPVDLAATFTTLKKYGGE